ncbi:hypothetical protein EZJ43_00705 [Pedobacter changchengzhani]|uniref:Cardiolipin synthase N-terminal domain-containing protein n=1 Tax=Pedobacter changchengzhani TaxID=2529274 RepID=A0A4R5MPL9_9SPHI|nr:hypothetical protein [Pedobacter changchengzhani]TDG37648.1 hypothetical protein EZJ43_00705 [Pedobacter changchengzhani]
MNFSLKLFYLTFCLVFVANFAHAAMLGTPEIILLLVAMVLIMVPFGLVIWLIIYLVNKKKSKEVINRDNRPFPDRK